MAIIAHLDIIMMKRFTLSQEVAALSLEWFGRSIGEF